MTAPDLSAFLGYAVNPKGGFMVRVCAWHDPALRSAAERMAGGLPITHGICPECAQRLMREVTGEREIPATQDSLLTLAKN